MVATLDQTFRDQWGYVLAALIGFLGDFELAEEATQEAFAIAAERWPRDGVPDNPGGWLIFEADDLDAAIELAARIPAARMGGAIEVRPLAGG